MDLSLSSAPLPAPDAQAERGVKPLFVIDGELRVHFNNRGASALAQEGIGAGDRFVTRDKTFSARLQSWLRRCRAGSDGDGLRLALETESGRQVSVDAVHLAGTELFILTVDDPHRTLDGNLARIVEDCGLTPMEARMLRLIVEGLDTVIAASRLGIAPTTARTHLQRLFAKTGTARQSELVRFVATYVEELR